MSSSHSRWVIDAKKGGRALLEYLVYKRTSHLLDDRLHGRHVRHRVASETPTTAQTSKVASGRWALTVDGPEGPVVHG